MTTRTLYGLATSPWTTKASFALDWAGVPYRYVEHTPMIGEPALRRRAKQKRASVPLLVDDGTPVMGSWAIALHASELGEGHPLVPEAEREHVLAWHESSERVLHAARALLLERLRQSPEALKENLPPFVPGPLRGMLKFSAKMAIEYLQKKYDCVDVSEQSRDAIVVELDALRAGLRGDTLLERFSFADITMAAALNAIAPTALEERTASTGPATRECWRQPELIERYGDLLAWRDAIYTRHRKRPA